MSPAFRWPLSVGAACYALALWAALFGVHTTYDVGRTGWVWWPGTIAVAALAVAAYLALQLWEVEAGAALGELHAALGAEALPVWAVACAAGFTLLAQVQLPADHTLTGLLTALQLLAAGTWALAWVAVRAPRRGGGRRDPPLHLGRRRPARPAADRL